MPSFVIVNAQHHPYGKAIPATLCALSASGYPDKRAAVPVKATIFEKSRTIKIDDEPPRSIISAECMNGSTTYCVAGSASQTRNAKAHRAVEQASA